MIRLCAAALAGAALLEVHALLPKEHQERIAKAGTNPMGL